MTNKKVTIYTTPTCHFCHLAKRFFDDKNIDYTEHNVAEDRQRLQHMTEISGQLGVPVIEIGEDIVLGFNEPTLKKLLKIK